MILTPMFYWKRPDHSRVQQECANFTPAEICLSAKMEKSEAAKALEIQARMQNQV